MQQPPLHHQPPSWRADIDGLRAVSIGSVVAWHAFAGKFPGGFIGVDVFFVISGFLITGLLLRDIEAGTLRLRHFWQRRILRIFPALLLVLFFCLVMGWFVLLADEYQQLGKHICAAAAFLSNFILMREDGYFDNAAETKPLLHLWSLGVEEQFYLLWPLVLYLARKTGLHLLATMLVLTLASFAWNVALVHYNQTHTFYAPYTRLWELSAGGCLAWLAFYRHSTLANIQNRWGHIFCLSGALLIGGSVFGLHQHIQWPGGWALLPVTGALLLIGAGENAWLNRTVLSYRPVVWVGLISFPLYLWHWPLLSFAHIMEAGMPQREIRIVAVLLAVVLAWATWAVVEKRVRAPSPSGQPRIKVLVLCALLAIAAAVGHVVKKHEGFPARAALQGLPEAIKPLKEDDPHNHAQCLERYGLQGQSSMRYCKISGAGKPRIALVGDSHAAALFSGLADALQQRDEQQGLLMMGGYLYTNVILHPKGKRAEFDAYTAGARGTEFIAREKSIDTVILAGRGPVYITTEHEFYLEGHPEITDKKKVLEIGLRSVLDLMQENGKKIIYVLEVPTLTFTPDLCQENRPVWLTWKIHDCLLPRATYEEKNREYLELVASILKDYPAVQVFDPSRYLCDAHFCTAKAQERILYGDDNHLSEVGSAFLAKELVQLLD